MLPEEQVIWDEFLAREAPAIALRAEFWEFVLTVWRAVRHPRRYPRRALAVVASAVVIAGMAVLAVNAPAQGCRLGVAPGPGRVRWECVETAATRGAE